MLPSWQRKTNERAAETKGLKENEMKKEEFVKPKKIDQYNVIQILTKNDSISDEIKIQHFDELKEKKRNKDKKPNLMIPSCQRETNETPPETVDVKENEKKKKEFVNQKKFN